jgi:hypothetical protein
MTQACTINVQGFLASGDRQVAFLIELIGSNFLDGILVKPSSLNLELSDEEAISAGVSLIESEATGLEAVVACELMNKHFASGLVLVESSDEQEAIE